MAASRARKIRPRLVGQSEGDRLFFKTGASSSRQEGTYEGRPAPGLPNVPGRSPAAVSLKSPGRSKRRAEKAQPAGRHSQSAAPAISPRPSAVKGYATETDGPLSGRDIVSTAPISDAYAPGGLPGHAVKTVAGEARAAGSYQSRSCFVPLQDAVDLRSVFLDGAAPDFGQP
jgi:hypothetical protein